MVSQLVICLLSQSVVLVRDSDAVILQTVLGQARRWIEVSKAASRKKTAGAHLYTVHTNCIWSAENSMSNLLKLGLNSKL